MKSKANTKAKILIFVSVMEMTQVFPILLLLIRIRFSSTWQKIPQISGLYNIEAISLSH